MRDKQSQKKKEKRKLKIKEKKTEQIHYSLLIFAMIFCVVNLAFIESKTIGGNNRYEIYIFLLPTIIGILFFGIYRKDFLIRKYLSFKETYAKIYMIGFYLLQGILVSYLSFGQIASVIWNCINRNEAEKNPTEIVICKVTGFYTKKNPDVSFDFKNQTEVFNVSSEMNRENYTRNPKDYEIEIMVQKGIWNYYIVRHWKLKNIR
ncbi:hypothetical protein Q1W71_04085 [Flavobacterium pectinovorum]|uniref:hypothetical protein n=1 Tax=Flavobacterium pectinovorum TaxID=29533 RepID=UPI00265D85D8|nr:hypothetical protein [Flavobacterium pectinovorum]WKL48966.1 hypothetical protein Q1W71_04085 [Flavobacterium pectinovorum]